MAMTPKEQLEILAAYVAGEVIQYGALQSNWKPIFVCGPDHVFNFQQFTYRKKPKPLELWVNVYEDEDYRSYKSKNMALASRGGAYLRTVHMREVVDDN